MTSKVIGRACALAALFAMAVAPMVPATATTASAESGSPVGRYRITTTTVKSRLIVDADHSFTITGATFTDTGTWAQLDNVVAFGADDGPDGGCVFVGALTAKGVSGRAKPGNFSCGGSSVFPWYAVLLPAKGGAGAVPLARESLRARPGRPVAPAATSIDATGSYDLLQNHVTTPFAVAADHTASWPDLGDSGSWAEFNDVAGFIVTSFTPDRGCFSLGRVHPTSINSAKFEGPSVCPVDREFSWFARRLGA